jgi:hypothetical protein
MVWPQSTQLKLHIESYFRENLKNKLRNLDETNEIKIMLVFQ